MITTDQFASDSDDPQKLHSWLPEGFLYAGIAAGIKEDKTKKDLGLLLAEKPAVMGGVYTKNTFCSAHVKFCRSKTPSSDFRALVVNSGNANAATGQAGDLANQQMAQTIADELELLVDQVFTSSTGIIGRTFPIQLINSKISKLIDNLEASPYGFSQAIMTTDLRPKIAFSKLVWKQKTYKVLGVAKGSGMIHPDMATMLAYVVTDAPLSPTEIQSITRRVADKSFNQVSVDRDSSTNDTYLLIGSNPQDQVDPALKRKVEQAVLETSVLLAKQIAIDGEGANHLIECGVKGCQSKKQARAVSEEIIASSLVKTAVHGRDPNWGRILMAIGNGLVKAGFKGTEPKPTIKIQDQAVFQLGEPVAIDEKNLSRAMTEKTVFIDVDLGMGSYKATSWGCDLSREYIRINADYHT